MLHISIQANQDTHAFACLVSSEDSCFVNCRHKLATLVTMVHMPDMHTLGYLKPKGVANCEYVKSTFRFVTTLTECGGAPASTMCCIN